MEDVHLRRAASRPALLTLALGALLATACSDEGDPTREAAGLRTLNLALDAPDLAVFLDAETRPLFEEVRYSGGTPYAPLDVGFYDLSFAQAGQGPQSTFLRVESVPLAGRTFTTLAVIGSGDADAGFPLETLLLVDERAPSIEGLARVRAIHAAPGVGDVDVLVTSERSVATPIATGLGYAEVGEYLELGTPTRYWFSVDVDADGEADGRLRVDVPFEANAINVFVALDAVGEPLIVAQLDQGNTQVSGLAPRPPSGQQPQ